LKSSVINKKIGNSEAQILHYARHLKNINVVTLRKQGLYVYVKLNLN